MEDGKIIRYVKVLSVEMVSNEKTMYGCWYIDDSDSAEKGDVVSARFKYQNVRGKVVEVVRCVYPYVILSGIKVNPIYEICERASDKV